MSQFYARYVPPAAKAIVKEPLPSPVEKRKRQVDDEPKSKKRKKQKKEAQQDETAIKSQMKRSNGISHDHLRQGDQKAEASQPADSQSLPKPKDSKVKKEKKKKSKQEPPAPSEDVEAEDGSHNRKHGSVLAKFNQARAEQPTEQNDAPELSDDEPMELHGLEPIPQPEQTAAPRARPTYSTLAPWQADAVQVVHRQSRSFTDLKVSESIAENLRKNRIDKSFPIQTTVLPLLLSGKQRHAGDVCVSAATGSGKTLSYVVPIVEDLKDYATTKLRAVIVVPTRELVQQVRQLCEICAAGTKLKLAAASGNKALKDEQNLLIGEEELYDPERWDQEQNAPMDWENFSMSAFLDEAQRQQSSRSIHFVKQISSKVDILITTPGRLVDHLRSTSGFNLDHVKWLVVDEADRLLNESYQEWVDTIMPALQSQAATSTRDELLKHMRMKPPVRMVQKVLLSATMTSDISKLSSLGLDNPKLVVLGHAQLESKGTQPEVPAQAATEGDFHLPPSLTEYVVPLKDGYEKPLYLLELLRTRILAPSIAETKPVNGIGKDEHSSMDIDSDADTSSDSDSTDPSSDSDSDSDSQSDSDSESSASSPTSNARTSPLPFKRQLPKSTKTPTNPNRALIFTRSTAAATRLSLLLSLLSPSSLSISTLTKSTSTSSASRRALSNFRSGKTSILIATDRASRGLDIPDLSHVISYDVPASALTYIHRVGRTARAGKEGTAWTLLEHREGRWFWGDIGGKRDGEGNGVISRPGGGKVQKVSDLVVDVEAWKERYEAALGKLEKEVKGKGGGE